MAKRKQQRGTRGWRGPTFLTDIVEIRSPEELVDDLAIPHRARTTFWQLMKLGPAAKHVVRAGLSHPNASVRRHCCEYFDHFLVEEAYEDLLRCVNDPDKGVRWAARHALACERCKKDSWKPPAEAACIAADSWARELAGDFG